MRRSALVAAVPSAGRLRRGPLGVGGLLAATVATSARRATVAHLGSITRRRLSGRAPIVTLLLTVLGCCETLVGVSHIANFGWAIHLPPY